MRALAVGLLLTLTVLAPATLASDPRTVTEQYVAGVGDLACAISGLGCVRVFAEGAETSVALQVTDTSGLPIAFDVCTEPTCTMAGGSYCATGVVSGFAPGSMVTVFLRTATGAMTCGLFRLGVPTTGTVTATFS